MATAILFALGCIPGFWISPHLSPPILAIVVTMFSILGGFLLNLMVTTGKIEGLSKRQLDEASAIVMKLRFLLWGHALTFTLFLATILLAISRAVLFELPGATLLAYLAGMFLCGSLIASLARAFLLPFQLAEIHLATYSWTLEEISEAEQKKVREQFRSKTASGRVG